MASRLASDIHLSTVLQISVFPWMKLGNYCFTSLTIGMNFGDFRRIYNSEFRSPHWNPKPLRKIGPSDISNHAPAVDRTTKGLPRSGA